MARGFVLKTADFQKAIMQYKEATKKDLPEVLNRALRNVGFRAAQFTPKKSPDTIEAELRKDKIGLKFITKKLTKKKGTTYQTEKGRTRTIRRVTRKQIALRTKQLISRRKKRTGFLRKGWVAAMKSIGVPVGRVDAGTFKGKSSLGRGQKATPTSMVASLSNAVYGRLDGKGRAVVAVQMRQALEKAMAFVAGDMRTYATERMQKTAAAYSARRKR